MSTSTPTATDDACRILIVYYSRFGAISRYASRRSPAISSQSTERLSIRRETQPRCAMHAGGKKRAGSSSMSIDCTAGTLFTDSATMPSPCGHRGNKRRPCLARES